MPAAADLDVAATVLGGLNSSRLDNALVRGAESAVAVTSSYQPFHRVGMFEVTVDVKPGQDVATVSAQLDKLIAEYVAQGPTDDEVARVAATRMAERIRALEPTGGFDRQGVDARRGRAVCRRSGLLPQGTGRVRRRDSRRR